MWYMETTCQAILKIDEGITAEERYVDDENDERIHQGWKASVSSICTNDYFRKGITDVWKTKVVRGM